MEDIDGGQETEHIAETDKRIGPAELVVLENIQPQDDIQQQQHYGQPEVLILQNSVHQYFCGEGELIERPGGQLEKHLIGYQQDGLSDTKNKNFCPDKFHHLLYGYQNHAGYNYDYPVNPVFWNTLSEYKPGRQQAVEVTHADQGINPVELIYTQDVDPE